MRLKLNLRQNLSGSTATRHLPLICFTSSSTLTQTVPLNRQMLSLTLRFSSIAYAVYENLISSITKSCFFYHKVIKGSAKLPSQTHTVSKEVYKLKIVSEVFAL